MKNIIHEDGNVIQYANSGSAISSGDVIALGDRCAVAVEDIAATTGVGSAKLNGVYELAADNSTAFSQGDQLFWDGSELTKTAAGNTYIGMCFEAKASSGTTGKVMLGKQPLQAAAVADLGQTISGTYSQSEVQDLSDKVDELLAALRASGQLANA